MFILFMFKLANYLLFYYFYNQDYFDLKNLTGIEDNKVFFDLSLFYN